MCIVVVMTTRCGRAFSAKGRERRAMYGRVWLMRTGEEVVLRLADGRGDPDVDVGGNHVQETEQGDGLVPVNHYLHTVRSDQFLCGKCLSGAFCMSLSSSL